MRGNFKFVKSSKEAFDGSDKVKFENDEKGMWEFHTPPVPDSTGIIDYIKAERKVIVDPSVLFLNNGVVSFLSGFQYNTICASKGRLGRKTFSNYCAIYEGLKECVAKPRVRLPRKLKNKIKRYIGTSRVNRSDWKFYLDAYNTAKYYGCKILIEKNGR